AASSAFVCSTSTPVTPPPLQAEPSTGGQQTLRWSLTSFLAARQQSMPLTLAMSRYRFRCDFLAAFARNSLASALTAANALKFHLASVLLGSDANSEAAFCVACVYACPTLALVVVPYQVLACVLVTLRAVGHWEVKRLVA
ncbi:hypothetical protein, partial [Rhodococcus sp. T9N]|uniref:hypothetical protein n=1 Tax=Rhodococcus sp. T9N TaxID=627445 RepID=UPI0021C423F8